MYLSFGGWRYNDVGIGDKEQQPSLSLSISTSKQENQSVVECRTHRIQAIIRMLYTILTIEIIALEEKSCMSSIILNKLVSSFSMKQLSLQGNINDNDDTNNTLIYTLEELFTRIHPIIKTLVPCAISRLEDFTILYHNTIPYS